MRQHLLALAVFMTVAPAGVAYSQPIVQSQEGIALENQILQLQQQVQQLQANNGGGGSALGGGAAAPAQSGGASPPDSSVVTQLLNQVGQLQAQVQQLNGEVDTLQNQVNTQHDATEKEIGDLKFQMSNGGAMPPAAAAAPAAAGPAASATPPAVPPAAVPAKPAAVAINTPHGLLRAAESAYYKHDDAAAEAYARSLLAHDNATPEAYHAQFLLAEILTAEGKPQDAAIAYDDAYNRDRTGTDAALSLLGLANSLADINQNEAACDTLSSLSSQFPTPPSGMQSRIAAVSQRAHCS